MADIILASASPRRRELLGYITNDFKVMVADCDETVPTGMNNLNVPEHLAVKKASAVAVSYPDSLVIGADTLVIIDDEILGKPTSEKDAFNMMKRLSGREHKVVTGCAVIYKNRVHSFSAVTQVEFYPLSDSEITDYIRTKDYCDKAGAYGIQSAGALLVKGIKGDYFNVVGLPVAMLNKKIKEITG